MATDLDKYPRPGVTVDLAILTVTGATDSGPDRAPELRMLIQDRTDPAGRGLPGGFIRERWTIAQTTADVLGRKVNIAPDDARTPRLLRVFDDPDRDDRTWAISIAHSLALRETDLTDAIGDLVLVTPDGQLRREGPLLFDHDRIVTTAIAALRARYEFRYRRDDHGPDPDGFLPEPFTLHHLRKVHEAVLGEEVHKDNFNRRMKPHLEPLTRDGKPVLSDGLRGRPATLYRTLARA